MRLISSISVLILSSWLTLQPCLADAFKGEVYRWTDANGKVHYGDKRHAAANDVKVAETSFKLDDSGQTLVLYPEADAELRESTGQTRGKAKELIAGFQPYRNTTRASKSIIKFDGSPLLRLMQQQQKRIASASLELSLTPGEIEQANKKVQNNAFFVIPSHNNWDEESVNWQQYYTGQNVPYPIRKLPSMTAPSSSALKADMYRIDALGLMQAIVQNNMRELTLEIKLQRTATRSEVRFHAKEAGRALSPKIRIEFME